MANTMLGFDSLAVHFFVPKRGNLIGMVLIVDVLGAVVPEMFLEIAHDNCLFIYKSRITISKNQENLQFTISN